MARVAFRTELALVDVVLGMTGGAIGARFDFSLCRFGVAGVAGEALVLASQRKARLFVVVEFPIGPAIWVVALGAIGAESAFVRIVFLVAVDATRRRVPIRGREMAFLARCGCM